MQAIHSDRSGVMNNHLYAPLAKGILWGLLGGLAATLVMDLILMGILVAAGQPALTCYSIVGDTVMRLLNPADPTFGASILSGVAAHYIIGPIMGGIFGAAVVIINTRVRRNAFRVDSRKKLVILAVLYAEIMSQPLLALTPILLRMTTSELLEWYGGAVGMHFIWACVLGLICLRGLRISGKRVS